MATPVVRLNGVAVGASYPGGAFYRDVPPGHYHLSADSYLDDPEQDRDVDLAPGQEIYAKILPSDHWIEGAAAAGQQQVITARRFMSGRIVRGRAPGDRAKPASTGAAPWWLHCCRDDHSDCRLAIAGGAFAGTGNDQAGARLPPTAAYAVPPIPAQEARIWFYRDLDPNGSMATPYLRLNDGVVGVSQAGGAFYRDVPAGHYHISADSYLPDPS